MQSAHTNFKTTCVQSEQVRYMGTGRWVLVLNHLATSCHTAVLHFDLFACILVEFYGFMSFSLKVNGFLIVWLDSESVLWHFDGAIN